MPSYINAQKLAISRPGDFDVPSEKDLEGLGIGGIVQVCFGGEYLWCRVLSISGENVVAESFSADLMEDPDWEEDIHTFNKHYIFRIIPWDEYYRGGDRNTFPEAVLNDLVKLLPDLLEAGTPIYNSIEQVGQEEYRHHQTHIDVTNQVMDVLGKHRVTPWFEWSAWWNRKGKGYVEYEAFLFDASQSDLQKLLTTHYMMEQNYPGHMPEMVRSCHLWLLVCRLNILTNYPGDKEFGSEG